VNFDVLAPHYRWMERLLAGEKLQRCRTAFLGELGEVQNILLAGEGHGRCLRECCDRFQNARITCIDASQRMLVQARRSLENKDFEVNRIEFIHANLLDWTPLYGNYDLIATNFFLDCFSRDELERVVCRLASWGTSKANWLLADFQMAASGIKKIRSRLILWSMYLFFRTMTRLPAKKLTVPDRFLEKNGFSLHGRIEAEWDLLHSDWWRR
jgi:cyclopropane fatty-acyl-phospholipid synthase-like methyltransferase